jgi:cytochrome c biogenesis protein
VLRAIVAFLTSARAGIVVMAILAVLSLLGAIIPQGGSHEAYVEVFGSSRGDLIWYTGLGNVYRSAYYSGLLFLLCIMVLACALKRLPGQVRQASRREFIADEKRLENMPGRAALELDVDAEEAALHAADICRKRLYRAWIEKRGEAFLVFASRTAFARYGSFLLHVSFIFLLAGGIAFTRFGYRSHEDVRVGGSFGLPGLAHAEVIVDDFEVVYDEFERLSDYVCSVILTDGGRPLLVKDISPNHPLEYKGREVFLVSYEQDFEALQGLVVSVHNREGEKIVPVVYLPFGNPLEVPGANLFIEAVDAVVPFARITYPAGEVESVRLEPDVISSTADGNLGFSVIHGVPSIIVTLEVVSEPGEWLVITGLLLLTAGSFICLYLSHRRIWFIVKDLPDRKSRVVFGGSASRNAEGFHGEFERVRRTLDELS